MSYESTTESGLVLINGRGRPVPPLPDREIGPLELDDTEDREKARRALSKLYNAMGLNCGAFREQIHKDRNRVYRDEWRKLVVLLLGSEDDGPEIEELT